MRERESWRVTQAAVGYGKEYTTVTTYAAWDAWQAACDCCAPKLTEAEAMEKAALCMVNSHLTALGAWSLEEARKREDWELLKSYAATVFHAIGTRFKEGA